MKPIEGIIITDVSGNILFTRFQSDQKLHLPGNKDNIFHFLTKIESADIPDLTEQLKNGGEVQRTISLKTKDGHQLLMTSECIPMKKNSKESDTFLWLLYPEINQQVLSENKGSPSLSNVQKSNRKHSDEILSAFPDLVFVLNKSGIIENCFTRRDQDLLVQPEIFLNRHFGNFLPQDINTEIDNAFQQALASHKVTVVRYLLPQNQNKEFYEGRFAPFADNSGAAFFVRNITQQYLTEEKLLSLSKLHQLIVEFSSKLVQSKPDEITENINQTLQKLGEYAQVDRVYIFEYNEAKDTVSNTYEWCSEGTSPEIENLQDVPFEFVPRWKVKFSRKEHVYIPLVSEIDNQYHVEKAILEPQGILSLLAIPMFNGVKLVGFIGFDSVKSIREWSGEHIDLLRLAGEIIAGTIARTKFEKEIIERRREAEQASKSKSEFLASMSHEIRTPMNAILGFSEILYNSATDIKSKSYLEGVLNSGKTLLHLINDILDLSKIEAGRMEIIEEPTELENLIHEVGRIFSVKISEKQLAFSINIEKDFPRIIQIDNVRLRQILFNLLGNAVKFTPKGSVSIDVKYQQAADQPGNIDFDIEVSDTGIGIPETYQQSIFEAFVQVESNNARKYGGTGLGLAITNRLVRMMNGTLKLKSEYGKGSTFTASFKNIKITTIQPDRKRRFEWTEKEISFEPATILVIDDVDYNRELAKTFLLQLNLHVLEARCANDGITIASVHQPDLILLDLRMPKMDGFEAVKLLKSNPKTKKIPCIAFTASTMKQEEKNILEMFDDYLLKPLTRNEMVDCLMKFLPHQIPDKQLKLKSNAETESALDPEKFAITPDKLVQLQKDCSNEIMPLLKNLKLYMDTDVSEKMILKLEKISENYQVPHCDFLAKQLKNSVENYDFTQFINVLNQLEQIITIITNK